MIADRIQLINEEFYAERVPPSDYDELLADGWRHFGKHYFRYNFGIYQQEIRRVIPLRIDLSRFRYSKSQRRTLRHNSDVEVDIGPVVITNEIQDLFERHRSRFITDPPGSIFDFVSPGNDESPAGLQMNVSVDSRLVAVSYFDRGNLSLSSIFAIFDPAEAPRRLGIFTMLKEIEFAHRHGLAYYYHGYAYGGESFYDYKKRFDALESFDWNGNWTAFSEPGSAL